MDSVKWETGGKKQHPELTTDLTTCLAAGWWSPPGLLTTPFYVVFNVLALMHRPDPMMPSERFRKLMRMNLARQLVRQ